VWAEEEDPREEALPSMAPSGTWWVATGPQAIGVHAQVVAYPPRLEPAYPRLEPASALPVASRVIERQEAVRRPLLAAFADTPAVRLPGHEGYVAALLPLPGGRIASAGSDDLIRVYRFVGQGQEGCILEGTLAGHTAAVTCLALVSGGRLASGSSDETIRLWHGPQCLGVLTGHSAGVRALAALGHDRLASGGWDRCIRIWHVPLCPVASLGLCERVIKGHLDAISALVPLSEGRLASASDDRTVRVWDARTGKAEQVCAGATTVVHALAVLPDGRLASCGNDADVLLWTVAVPSDAQGPAGRLVGAGPGYALRAMGDGRLAVGGSLGAVALWDTNGEAAVAAQVLGGGHGLSSFVRALAVLPDGSVVSGASDGTLCQWL